MKLIFSTLLAALLTTTICGQAANLEGTWLGTLDLGGTSCVSYSKSQKQRLGFKQSLIAPIKAQ